MNQKRVRKSMPRAGKKASTAKSGKQKRLDLDSKRETKRKERAAQELARLREERREQDKLIAQKRREGVNVDPEKLRPNTSYSRESPAFVSRGYYVDRPFICKFCGGNFIFTGKLQKWWYETVKAKLWSSFNRCEACQLKLNAAKEAKQQEDARRAAKNKIRKLRAAGKLTPKLEKELLAAARKGAT